MTDNIEDAEWEEIPDNNGKLSKRVEPKGTSHRATSPAPEASPKPTIGQKIKTWVKRVLIGLGALFVLLIVIGMLTPDPETESTAPAAAGDAVAQSSDQMLSDWSEFAIGEARTTRFGLTDGSGTPGEFCSASDGETIMAFGPPPSSDGEPKAYESFVRLDSAENTAANGSFQFNRADGTLVARGLSGRRLDNEEPVPVPDFTMKAEATPDGTVIIDGRTFHHCIP